METTPSSTSRTPVTDLPESISPGLQAMLEIERKVAASKSYVFTLLDRITPLVVSMAAFFTISPQSALVKGDLMNFVRGTAIAVLALAVMYVADRQSQRRLALVLSVLREIRNQPSSGKPLQ